MPASAFSVCLRPRRREKVREQFNANVFGRNGCNLRAILPHFRKNRGGLILNVSSGAGVFTLPMISLYCASKFALVGLFRSQLSYELASQNIIVKIIELAALSAQISEKEAARRPRTTPLQGLRPIRRRHARDFCRSQGGAIGK